MEDVQSGTVLNPRSPRRKNLPWPFQGHHRLSGFDGLDGLERAVSHHDALALGHAVLHREVLRVVVGILAVAELDLVPASERPGVLASVVMGSRVDGSIHRLGAADGLLQLRELPAKVKRPARRPSRCNRVRVVRVHHPLVFGDDLREWLCQQRNALAHTRRACAKDFVRLKRVNLLLPLGRRVGALRHG